MAGYQPPNYGRQPGYGQQSYYGNQQQGQQQSYQQPGNYGSQGYSTTPQPPAPYQPYGQGNQQSQQYPQYPQYGGSQPGYPQSYGQPHGQQTYGQPPQGQPQYPPPQGGYPPQGGQYGGAPPPGGNPGQVQAFKQSLQQTIQEKRLQGFYPPNSPILDQIANRAAQQVEQICSRWRMPREIGSDICKLGLFDIWIYIDDSGSMQFEENGSRIDDLKLILQRATYAATLFDDDGINLRFMNSAPPFNLIDHIKSEQQIDQLMPQIQFKGLTPMGTELKNKVIEPILNEARSGRLRKPVLVIAITDGQPAGEPQNAVTETIKYANNEFSRMSQYGPGAISFQFAQVGNDLKAREFLGKLDADPAVGHLIDCTSNYENESEEMGRANPPVNLTPELWLVKLLLGSIDSSYDRKDEKSGHAQQQGGYGGPPQQQGGYGGGYQQQQGGYGAPQQQQGGYPPQQGGYGQQQGGYGQQQQGGYGAPQHGGGYPPQQQGGYGQQGGYPSQQQGGYGGAPPPPRY